MANVQKHNGSLQVVLQEHFSTIQRLCQVGEAAVAYIRFHGSSGLYYSCYTDRELDDWARRISELAKSLDAVYIYFNNDAEGYAVRNAQTMREKL